MLGILLMGCTHSQRTNESSTMIGKPGETSDLGAHTAPELLNSEWILESLGPVGSEESIGAAAKITIVFGEDGRFHGSAGCNRYFGTYEVGTDHSLSTGKTGSTMMMCPDEIMDWESRYLQTLKHISSYRTENMLLMLFHDGEEKALTFQIQK
jgi:heat shock protein HslJ